MIVFSFCLILPSVTTSTLPSSIPTMELSTQACLVCLHHHSQCRLPKTQQQIKGHWPLQSRTTSVAAWCPRWKTWTSSGRTLCSYLSCRGLQCYLTSPVCYLGATQGTVGGHRFHPLPVNQNRVWVLTNSSLVSPILRCRWFLSHLPLKFFIRSLDSSY